MSKQRQVNAKQPATRDAQSPSSTPISQTSTPKSNRQAKREAAAAYARKRRMQQYVVFGAVALVAVLIAGLVIREAARPRPGEAVSVMASDHIPENSAKPSLNSNPPTSGPHYATTARQGFYPANAEPPKDELLIHNLEHGHVIMWYDCSRLDAAGCDGLQKQVQQVISKAKLSAFTPTKKLVVVPRKDFGALIALTAWGRIMKLEAFDEGAINAFITEWREKSPEPTAP